MEWAWDSERVEWGCEGNGGWDEDGGWDGKGNASAP